MATTRKHSTEYMETPTYFKKGFKVPEGGYSASVNKTAAPAAAAPAAAPAADNSVNDYYNHLQSLYDAQLEEQRRQRQAAYDAAVQAQTNAYNQNVGKVNQTADKALQEAYINKMQALRTQRQAMAAQGLTGGASETTLASMNNSYGNARNNLELDRSEQLKDLYQTYQNNIAAAQQILSQGNAADYSQYVDRTGDLIAQNAAMNISMKQGAGNTGAAPSGATAYTKYLMLIASGMKPSEAMAQLQAEGYNYAQIFAGQQ